VEVEEGIIERIIQRLEKVPLSNISSTANEIAWKRHNYIPMLALEVQDILSQTLGSNYIVITPSMIIADVEYRSWHSKTYCRDADCIAEEYLYEKLVEILKKLRKPLKEEVVKEWRHYCGASPIYHRYNIVILRKPIYYVLATYNGARVWHAEYHTIPGAFCSKGEIFLTDGCIDWESFVNPPKP